MNFEDLYKIKNKLESIYEKLEIITGNKYDSSEIKKSFEAIETFTLQYENVPNSISNASTLIMKQDKKITQLLKVTESLESFVNEVYSSLRIFDDIKDVEKLFNRCIPSKEETLECTKVILNDLLNYNKLLKTGKFTEDRFTTDIAPTLYKLIKSEMKYTGSSTILNALYKMNIDTSSINSMLFEESILLCDRKDVKHRLIEVQNEIFKQDKIDSKLLLLVSTYNDNFKGELIKLLNDKKNELDECKDSYDEYVERKKKKSKDEATIKKRIKHGRSLLLKQIMPITLSLSILVGANLAIVRIFKNQKHVIGTTYSTVDGTYDCNGIYFTTAESGEIQITEYSKVRTDKQRTIKKYVLPDTLENLEDYVSTEISDEYLVSEKIESNDDEKPDEEYTIVTRVDEAKKDAELILLQSLLNMVVTAIWLIFDMLIGEIAEVGVVGCAIPTKENINNEKYYIKEALDIINQAKNELLIREDGSIFSKEELVSRKKKLEELNKQYKELIEEYSYLEEILKDGSIFSKEELVSRKKKLEELNKQYKELIEKYSLLKDEKVLKL